MNSYNKYRLIAYLTVFSFFARSSIFKPVPIEEQLKTADAVIHGSYERIQGYKNDNTMGMVFTEHSLKLISTAGVRPQGLRYKFLTPGGVWQGVVQELSSAPRFEENEEVLLLLKSNAGGGYSLHNSSLGKYNVIDRDGQKILVNDVFPDDKRLSNFSFDQFNRYVRERFGNNLERVPITVSTSKKSLRESKKLPRPIKKPPLMKKPQRQLSSVKSFQDKVQDKDSSPTFSWSLLASLALASVLLPVLGYYFFTKKS